MEVAMSVKIRAPRSAGRFAAGVALLVLASAAGPASAQVGNGQAGKGQGGALRQACAADVQTLCAGIQPGGGRLKTCLREHADKVSDGCKTALKAAKAARVASKPAAS